MSSFFKIWNIAVYILSAVMLVLALLLVGVRIVGLKPFAVMSDSMEPQYMTGSLLYVKNVKPDEVQPGDVITFYINTELETATHRVTAVDEENRCFYTKGDANETSDIGTVNFGNLIGIPLFSIPLLGYVSCALAEPAGVAAVVIIAVLIIVLAFVPELIWRDRRRPMSRSERRKFK